VEPEAQDLISKHPYAKASGPNANVVEPQPPVLPLLQKNERAYTTTSNIYDHRVVQKVYDRLLKTEVTITQCELLLLVPEIRMKISDATVRQRITRTNVQAPLEFAKKQEHMAKAHMPAAFSAATRTLPANVTIIADPYEAFLKTRPSCHDCPEEAIKVAAESNLLRAILPIIDGQEKVKVILDPGCQIVAMLEEVCTALALLYDPDIQLNMVLVNGGVNQSLGLTWNVPFLVGEIMLYLQVHVLHSPAYDILLGQPFDTLTQLVVCNFHNKNQTITVVDPNTGKKVMVPTILCGSYQFTKKCQIAMRTQEQVSGF